MLIVNNSSESDVFMIQSTLFNMMQISNNCCPDYHLINKFINDENIESRNYAVTWMKQCVQQVLGVDCPCTRDLSVQILDQFLVECYSENTNTLLNSDFLSYSAAGAVILASKLNDTNSKLTMSKFSNFDLERLIYFEQLIISKTSSKISPLCTPSSFLHYIIDVSTVLSYPKDIILDKADQLISEFWKEADSVLYAPSTIAISALLISFSILKIPCTNWLNSIPLYFFMNDKNPFFDCNLLVNNNITNSGNADSDIYSSNSSKNVKFLFLDQEKCIASLEKIPSLRSLILNAKTGTSPTSVCNAIDFCDY